MMPDQNPPQHPVPAQIASQPVVVPPPPPPPPPLIPTQPPANANVVVPSGGGSGGKGKLFAILGAVLVLVMIGIGGFIFLQQGQEPTEPIPTFTPAPQVTTYCSGIRAYDKEGDLITNAGLSGLLPGDMVRFAVSGITSSGSFDSAMFTINSSARPAVTTKVAGTDEYYDEYVIPEGETTFEVSAQIHHLDTDTWYTTEEGYNCDLSFTLTLTQTSASPSPKASSTPNISLGGNLTSPTPRATVTPRPTATAISLSTTIPTPLPDLPVSGVSLPTFLGIGLAFILFTTSIFLFIVK